LKAVGRCCSVPSPHEKTFFTETDGLDAEFLERMRRDSKLIEQWLKESRVEP
jgi:hypothetical protein